MATDKVYIGNELADYSGSVGVVFSGGDIRNITEGRVNSSYEIELPLTPKNKKLLKYSDHLNVFTEVSADGMVVKDDIILIRGKVIVLDVEQNVSATILIQGTSWYEYFKDLRLRDLDLSANNHTYNKTNIENSWTGSANFYRYPMINFGALFNRQTGTSANWLPNDFIPMFRIVDILEAIFSPFVLAGGWLTEAAEKYILGKEPVAPNEYKQDKAVNARVQTASDNQVTDTVPAGSGSYVITFAEAKLILNDVVTNEGTNFSSGSTSSYTIPVTGTYRFQFDASPFWLYFVGLTINAQTLRLKIVRDRGGSLTDLVSQTWTYVSTDILLGVTYSIDTGHIHLEDGDIIYVTGYMVNDLANSGISRVVNMNFAASITRLYAVPDNRWLYTGIGKSVVISDWLPDIKQMDFVTAVKEAYNLRFMPDVLKQTIYIESGDDTYTDNERTLSGIDTASLKVENVAKNYCSTLRLKLITDNGDRAIADVVSYTGEEYFKDIVLSSLYAEKDTLEYVNSLFAWTVKGAMYQIGLYTPEILRIFGDQGFQAGYNFPEFRPFNFAPRLLTWNGLTSGITWYYDGVSKTTYPQATSEDMDAVYDTNFQKTFHLIDRGKIVKLEAVADRRLMQEFMTVVSNINLENFRPKYKFMFGGEYFYGYLNKIEFGGERMHLEMIIKH